MSKPILCLDFDGVIHNYSKGWQDGTIYDDAVPGFFAWASKAREHFRLVIYSSRSKDPAQLVAMLDWLRGQLISWKTHNMISIELPLSTDDFEFAYAKPQAFLTIDDRAMQFRGEWSTWWLEPTRLAAFKPWNQGADQCAAAEPKTALQEAALDLIDALLVDNAREPLRDRTRKAMLKLSELLE